MKADRQKMVVTIERYADDESSSYTITAKLDGVQVEDPHGWPGEQHIFRAEDLDTALHLLDIQRQFMVKADWVG